MPLKNLSNKTKAVIGGAVLATAVAGGSAAMALTAGTGSCPSADQLPPMTVCLDWIPPTQNVDGSVLTDLASYNVYYGEASGTYVSPILVSDPNATTGQLDASAELNITDPGPDGGTVTVFFAMTASDSSGNESAFSNEISRDIVFPDTLPPNAPSQLNVILNVNPS